VAQAHAGELYLHFDPQGALLEATLDCERSVFADRYGFPAEEMDGFYAPFAESSTFLALADRSGYVVAMARYVFPNPNGLVTTREIGKAPWLLDGPAALVATGLDLEHTWDVATLAVRSGSRRFGVLHAAAMYHGLIRASAANDIRGFVAVMDERVRRLMAMLGLMVRELPGAATAPYEGSPATTPVFQLTSEFIGGQRRTSPDAYRLVTLGVGLDGIHVPDNEAFRLKRPRVVQLPAQTGERTLVDRTISVDDGRSAGAHVRR
jgi:hypothetical protein